MKGKIETGSRPDSAGSKRGFSGLSSKEINVKRQKELERSNLGHVSMVIVLD